MCSCVRDARSSTEALKTSARWSLCCRTHLKIKKSRWVTDDPQAGFFCFWLKAVYCSKAGCTRNQLFLISWIPSKSAVISRATEIDWPFAYLKDWGCKPVGLNISLGIQRELMCVIMLTSICYLFNIAPIIHAVHSIPVVYHLYGEWSSKGQVRTASSSVLSPSLPLRLQVGLKHLNTVQHRFQENTPIALAVPGFFLPVPCWVHLQSIALRLCWCLLSCGHSDIISSSSSIVGFFEPSHTDCQRDCFLTWLENVVQWNDVYFLPVCRLHMMSVTLAKIFFSHAT